MPRLTHDQRIRIVTLHDEAGRTIQQLTVQFRVDRRTVQRLLRKHRETQSVDDRLHPGRARKTTVREDRVLIRMSAGNPRQVARELRQRWNVEHGVDASLSTVKDRLNKGGLPGRIARKKPLLTQRHRQARLEWARQHRNWTVEQWNNCYFSDESPLHLVQASQRRYVRRRSGTAMHPQHIRPTVHSSSGKMDVWGAFSRHGVRPLVRYRGNLNAEAYTNILNENLVPLNLQAAGKVFQQDNATCHTARTTQRFLAEHHIEVIPWPAQSPDLSPIENLWAHIQREVDAMPVNGFDGLWAAAQEVWQNIPDQLIANLISSMPRRCQLVIDALGGSIKY